MPELYLGSSPHIGTHDRTWAIIARVLTALIPVTIFGIVMYGFPAFLMIVVSIASAVGGETLFRLIVRREKQKADLSAVVSGLLLALVLPPGTPLWMTALGGIFTTVVAKEFFGGLGVNIFNPALLGRVFLLICFPTAITNWTTPRRIFPEEIVTGASVLDAWSATSSTGTLSMDAISGATPLGILKMGGTASDIGNQLFAAGLAGRSDYVSTARALFLGWHGGCIGESSILLILLGCIFLLVTKVIDWRAPVAMAAASVVLSLLLGMDPLFCLLTGGLIFGAVFMATDYTTAPFTAKGKFIFGAGAGVISILIRRWGNFPEGVSYGILIMNALTPFLNRMIQKKYGFVPLPKKVKMETNIADKPAEIMGTGAVTATPMMSVRCCIGGKDIAVKRGVYTGIPTCQGAKLTGGTKLCNWGCIGLGDCVAVCKSGALSMEDGLPVVNWDKCTGCKACVNECPQGIFRIIPKDTKIIVALCSNRNPVRTGIRKLCYLGCVKCGICVKQCPEQCIRIENGIPIVDYNKCTVCGTCEGKCPTRVLRVL